MRCFSTKILSNAWSRWGLLIPIGLGLTATPLSGCSKNTKSSVGVSAAESIDAQAELRAVEEQWEVGSTVARKALREELEQFLSRYPTDPSGARARVMLAQIALLERRYGSAETVLGPVLNAAPGRSRDEALVIIAAVANRRGDPERALELLSPLRGKLLTREARDQYARERTVAAMSARKWRLSVSAMIDWLTESGVKNAETREWIEGAIREVPTVALSRLLADWSSREEPEASGPKDWVHRFIILHVTRKALEKQDPLLARDLLERSPPWLRASEQGDELSLLAALAAQDAKVKGRAVGMVLGGDTEQKRRRTVRLAAGILRGLNSGQGSPIRFLATEDRGSLESALGTLSGLGATVLVAGVEAKGAAIALRYAERRRVPVVTMSAPETKLGESSQFGFVFGVSVAEEKAAMARVLAAAKWAYVGLEEVSCDKPLSRPSSHVLPGEKWRARGIAGIGVFGDTACLNWVNQAIRSFGWEATLVSGLESAHEASDRDIRTLGAGAFPKEGSAPSDRLTAREEAAFHGKALAEELPKDWYFLLGYDAARLIRAALLTLPETDVKEKFAVQERHLRARDALVRARTALQTSKSQGFAGNRLSRDLRVIGEQ